MSWKVPPFHCLQSRYGKPVKSCFVPRGKSIINRAALDNITLSVLDPSTLRLQLQPPPSPSRSAPAVEVTPTHWPRDSCSTASAWPLCPGSAVCAGLHGHRRFCACHSSLSLLSFRIVPYVPQTPILSCHTGQPISRSL